MNKVVMPNDVLLGEVSRLVAEGETVTIMTKGNSMLPFIRGGRDSVSLERPERLEPGMIALAEVSEGVYVLHRIMTIEDGTVVLMGDGNLKGREKCRTTDVKAIATYIIRNGRRIDTAARRHQRQARIWKSLLPVRRWLLAFYRRIFI